MSTDIKRKEERKETIRNKLIKEKKKEKRNTYFEKKLKKARKLFSKDPNEKSFRDFQSLLAVLAQKGYIHRNKRDRLTSKSHIMIKNKTI